MIDDKKAIDSLNNTDKKAGGVGQSLLGMGKNALKGAAVVGGATLAAGAALFGMASKAADTTDRIDKLSQKVGLSKGGFQEWEYVLSQNGMEIESLQGGMKKLTTVADQAIQGTGRGAEIFKQLGISVKDSSGAVKDQETIFNESVAALQGMEDGTEKARLATELFGGAGAKLMPLLNGSAESVDELKQAARDMGLVMSDDAVAAGAKFTDTMDNVKRSLGAIGTRIGVAVMPMFQTFLDFIMSNMPTIQRVLNAVFGAMQVAVQLVIDIFNDYFVPILSEVIEFIKAQLPAIKDTFQTVFAKVKEIFDTVVKPVLKAIFDAFGNIVKTVIENLPSIKDVVMKVFGLVKQYWDSILKPVILAIVDFVVNRLIPIFKEYFPVIKDIVKTVFGVIKDIWTQTLMPAFKQIIDFIRVQLMPEFKRIFPIIEEVVKTVFKTIKNIWESILKPALMAIKDFLNAVLKPAFALVFPIIKTLVKTAFDGILFAWKNVLKPAFDAINSIIKNVIKPIFEKTFPVIRDAVVTAFEKMKSVWDTVLKPAFDAIKKLLNDTLKPVFKTVFEAVQKLVEGAFKGIGTATDGVLKVFDSVKEKVDNVLKWFTDFKDGISEKINGAKEAVTGAIDKIKKAFDFKFTWPKLSMPKFSIEGSMNPLKWLSDGVPKLKVNWNAAGAIFDRPTIFTTPYGLQGVGEAGPEAVAPIGKLQSYIAEAVASANNSGNTDNLLKEILKALSNLQIVMDTGELVGVVSSEMNFKTQQRLGGVGVV